MVYRIYCDEGVGNQMAGYLWNSWAQPKYWRIKFINGFQRYLAPHEGSYPSCVGYLRESFKGHLSKNKGLWRW